MVLPPPTSQEADAGGLGLLLLSACAEPSRAITPTVKHPTARNATVLFMVFPPRKLVANIEANLPLQRNPNCRRSVKTHPEKICFVSTACCEKARKGLIPWSAIVDALPGVGLRASMTASRRRVLFALTGIAGILATEALLGGGRTMVIGLL